MEASFWHQKWQDNQLGWHESKVNPMLTAHFKDLKLDNDSCVFVPLCGKTLDIAWLLANGYRVVGAELSELAIVELFVELGIEPSITRTGKLACYSATDIDIFVGDIFDLTPDLVGRVDAVYDRAALVALPADMRKLYAPHLLQITNSASQLLITYTYDQEVMEGPPFSLTAAEVKQHYESAHAISLLEQKELPGGIRGTDVVESVWLLEKFADYYRQ